jgi:hypothetical protein
MKKIITSIILIVSLSAFADVEIDFSLSDFCYQQPNVQYRNGVYYFPNESVGITDTSICVYKDAYGQYSSKGNIVKGYFDGLWTGWDRNGEIWLETYYINRKVVPIVCRDDLLDFFKDETYYDDYDNPLTAFNRCDTESLGMIAGKGVEIINGKREGYWGVHFGDRVIGLNYVNGILNGKVTDTYLGEVHKTTGFRPVLQEFAKMYKDGELASQELTLDQTELVDETDSIDEMILAIEKESALRSSYINNIAARVRAHWRFQGAGYDWTAEVYVAQDRDGTVLAVDIRNTNVGDSNKAKAFINSIERAVYKASPLPSAPDKSVFNEQLIFTFKVN